MSKRKKYTGTQWVQLGRDVKELQRQISSVLSEVAGVLGVSDKSARRLERMMHQITQIKSDMENRMFELLGEEVDHLTCPALRVFYGPIEIGDDVNY